MKKFFIVVLTLGFITITLTACGTIEGVGKDLKRAGQAVEKEAKKY